MLQCSFNGITSSNGAFAAAVRCWHGVHAAVQHCSFQINGVDMYISSMTLLCMQDCRSSGSKIFIHASEGSNLEVHRTMKKCRVGFELSPHKAIGKFLLKECKIEANQDIGFL